MPKVTIYSTQTCPYCKMAKLFFNNNNIEYTDKDVGEDQGASEEMIKKSGQMSVPVIVVDNQVVIGFDEAKLKELLKIS